MTLLNYLVRYYVRNVDEDAGTDKSKLPLPEPSDINQASLVNFDELQEELKKAAESVKGIPMVHHLIFIGFILLWDAILPFVLCRLTACQGRVSRVIRASTPETVQPFKTTMMSFLDKGKLCDSG